MVCSAAWSIGLSADDRCLVHDDESPVTHTTAPPIKRATTENLSLIFIVGGLFRNSHYIAMLSAQIVTATSRSSIVIFFDAVDYADECVATLKNPRRRQVEHIRKSADVEFGLSAL